jgi:hypothetical protein
LTAAAGGSSSIETQLQAAVTANAGKGKWRPLLVAATADGSNSTSEARS